MFTMFSEIIRKMLLLIATILTNTIGVGFRYLYSYNDKNTNQLFVKYLLNGKTLEEPYEDFIDSQYFKLLSSNHIKKLINNVATEKNKEKLFNITQNEYHPELFDIKNTTTGMWSTKLLADIMTDSYLLENISSASIKELINGSIKLSASGTLYTAPKRSSLRIV